jgi:hypothetical protein
MGWDSNPRDAFTPAGFQDRCLKPLGHPSNLMSSISRIWEYRKNFRFLALWPRCFLKGPHEAHHQYEALHPVASPERHDPSGHRQLPAELPRTTGFRRVVLMFMKAVRPRLQQGTDPSVNLVGPFFKDRVSFRRWNKPLRDESAHSSAPVSEQT